MRSFRNLVASVAIFSGLVAISDSARASDCYKAKYSQQTVVVWLTVQIPVVHTEVKYDCDGHPHKTKVLSHRTQKIAVEKRVFVAL